jgi:hypothetical protein
MVKKRPEVHKNDMNHEQQKLSLKMQSTFFCMGRTNSKQQQQSQMQSFA